MLTNVLIVVLCGEVCLVVLVAVVVMVVLKSLCGVCIGSNIR